jgi:hypothetical protein
MRLPELVDSVRAPLAGVRSFATPTAVFASCGDTARGVCSTDADRDFCGYAMRNIRHFPETLSHCYAGAA